ncbi:MAG: hypothetical protein AAGK97_14545, partial [Bacteroidota bacterium]
MKLLFVLIILFLFCLHFILPRLITQIKHPIVAIAKPKVVKPAEKLFDPQKGKSIVVNASDGIQLTGFLSKPILKENSACIILLHGIRS